MTRSRPPTFAATFAALALAACAGGRPAVSLDGDWPESARDYDEVTRAWTRHDRERNDFEIVIDAHATYLSPEWRAALVERRAEVADLTAQGRAELSAAQKQAAAAAHEFHVAFTAFDDTEETLHDSDPTWEVVLIDATGKTIRPLEINRDRRNEEVIRAELPHVGDFDSSYIVRFPTEGVTLLGPEARSFALRFSSPRGGVELVWAE